MGAGLPRPVWVLHTRNRADIGRPTVSSLLTVAVGEALRARRLSLPQGLAQLGEIEDGV